MEKTISVNLSGILFNIDEDAYGRLSAYFDDIKNHYRGEADEIMNDIEASIAEKFAAKTKDAKKIITLADVEEVIAVMGTVKDFAEAEAGAEIGSEEKQEKADSARKLYRSTDDVIIAGVSSGLAAYFGVDALVIRLIFIVLAFANGLGIIIYAIFWIVVPKAETSVEKLEMRGAPVNLKKIEETVREKSAIAREKSKEAFEKFKETRPDFFRRLASLPVRIVEAVALFLKKIFRGLGPIFAVLIGLPLMIASLAGILGASFAASLILFQIDSPYLVSDLPVNEIAAEPMFYVAVIAGYLIMVIPLMFLSALGVTLVRRKNSFRMPATIIMTAVWIMAAAAATVAAADIVPKFSGRWAEWRQAETVVREYDHRDFSKLYLGADMDVTVRQGEEFSISMSGLARDLDRLGFTIDDGQLQVLQGRRAEPGKICLFCFDSRIQAEITMPNLDSFVAFRSVDTDVRGFKNDLYISLGEAADAVFALSGQNVDCRLSGVGSELLLTGSSTAMTCELDGSAHLVSADFQAENIVLSGRAFSRMNLEGEAGSLRADLDNFSRLDGAALTAGSAEVTTSDNARVDVRPTGSLKASARDSSRIIYRGQPAAIDTSAEDSARVEPALNVRSEDNGPLRLRLIAEPERYAPYMSSVRGITLTPVLDGEGNLESFVWKTNYGRITADWENLEKAGSIFASDRGDKVFWTFLTDDQDPRPAEDEPVYIRVSAKEEGGFGRVSEAEVRLEFEDGGVVRVVE